METVQVEKKGSVAWVWLNRPQRLNAMNEATLAGLKEAFVDMDRDSSVKVIVLAGRGPVFCAGFDITWMVDQNVETLSRELPGVEAVYDTIEACAKPVIAAVQGVAFGGGLLLVLVSDFCLAAEGANLGAPEVKIGIFPNLRLIPRLERVVGLRAAKRMVLTGGPLAAGEAQALGLVDRVLPVGELYQEAQALAEQLAGLPPVVLQAAKAAFGRASDASFPAWEREQFVACWARPEREAAMRAFLASR